MAGKVVISTLNNDTGVLATQNGMTGIAKAWVNFNGTGTPAIRSSFNVSSITDNGVGNYTINFTTAMPDANYGFAGSAQNTQAETAANVTAVALRNGTTPTTSAINIQVNANLDAGARQAVDSAYVCLSVFSS